MARLTNPLSIQQTAVIGPQLGLCNRENAILVTVALPEQDSIGELVCVLVDEHSAELRSNPTQPLHPIFRNYVFEFDNLKPGKKYHYKFFHSGSTELHLEGGLTYSDCWFYAPVFNDGGDKFVLLSCNNPFHSGFESRDDQFRMWKLLNDRIADYADIKLIVQGGDQVYNDRIEELYIKKLEKQVEDLVFITEFRQQIIRNYQDFYSDLNYRKILARIPSVAMLDDHDITDGWGGRDEIFDKKDTAKITPHWAKFFEITYEAFKAFQACKNPKVPHPFSDKAATTYLDMGNNRLFLMDYRSEKNFFQKRLISEDHENKILKTIRETSKRIFILSPVVPARIDPQFEEGLGWFTSSARLLNKVLQETLDKRKTKIKKWKWWTKVLEFLFLASAGVGAFADDIYDSLSATTNKPYFLRLMKASYDAMRSYSNEVVVLSGDIHTGGLSEIFVSDKVIPQIVSSPIGYEPMNKVVKGVTTTESERTVDGGDVTITFRNIFFRSKRNFAIITPGRLHETDGVEFHFENLTQPIYSSAYFSKPPA